MGGNPGLRRTLTAGRARPAFAEFSMLWSIPIAVIAGTVVRIHVTFLLFLVWIAGTHWRVGGQGGAVDGGLLLVVFFACVGAHEVGPRFFARAHRVRPPGREVV